MPAGADQQGPFERDHGGTREGEGFLCMQANNEWKSCRARRQSRSASRRFALFLSIVKSVELYDVGQVEPHCGLFKPCPYIRIGWYEANNCH